MAEKAKAEITINRFSATMAAIHRHVPLSRFAIHWSKGSKRLGTVMRYFIFRGWTNSCALTGTGSKSRLSSGCVALAIEGASIGLVCGTQGLGSLLL